MAITRAQQVRQMLQQGGPPESVRRGGGAGSLSVSSSNIPSANRVAAATNIKSMQDAFGTKDNITADQQINRQRIRDQKDRTIETIEDRNREDRNRKIADAFSKILPTRRGLFERGLLIPGARKSITNQRAAYAKYLRERGIDPSEELEDTDDLFRFFEKQAFDKSSPDYEPNPGNVGTFNPEIGRVGTKEDAILNYGDFLLDKFDNPTVKYAGDIGAYNREMGFERGDNAPVQIANKIITDPTDPTDPNQTTDIFSGVAPRFAGSKFDFDALRRRLAEESAADGGRIGAMEGGIMDLETAREAMFLGGIAKGLKKITKKATRAIKKVAKSPIGKAALLGGLGYLGFQGIGGREGLSKFLFKEGGKGLGFGELLKGGMTGKGMLALGGGLALAPFLFGKQEEDDPDPNRGPKLTMEQLLAIRGAPFNTLAPRFTGSTFAAEGGRMGYQEGSKEPVAKKVMPLLDMGGKEMDLRDNGGFVPIGRMEKADDVPARLSKNEFVFTADAVRNAGDGDVDKGSEVMYNMMKNLESGGEVSEESQGLQGAREMFQKAQRLEEVI